MKILAVGDLHGRKPKIHFKDFDVIVVVGDVCSDKGFRSLKNAWVKYLEKNPDEPKSDDEFFILQIGKKKVEDLYKESLKEGRKIMEFLNSIGKPIFMTPGNWDQSYGPTRIKDMEAGEYSYYKSFLDFWIGDKINPKLVKGLKNVKNIQFKLHKFKGYNLLGYGLSSLYENPELRGKRKIVKFTKKEFGRLKRAYMRILKKLGEAYKKRDKNFPTIFITHNVPYGTKIDTLHDKDSEHHGKHFGSSVARWFCNKYQPLLCIGGHMHEHFGEDKIKKTTAINVGFGSHVNTLIELEKGKIKKIDFWDGKKNIK